MRGPVIMLACAALVTACGGSLSTSGENDATGSDTATDTSADGVTETAPDVPDDNVPEAAGDTSSDPVADPVDDVSPEADAGMDAEPDAPAGCTAPLVDCGGTCVNVSNNTDHCGRCDHGCEDETCVAGECGGHETCPPGYVHCGWPFGECRDVSGDPENCGGCGEECERLEHCTDGWCECRPGFADCVGCVDLLADEDNCGGCGSPCGDVCVDGVCAAADDCALSVCDDACVDTETDPRHCGGCGDDCERDQLCIGGECWDYEPAIGCLACAGCDACPGDETCCEVPAYGVMCVETEVGCP